jgi:hypothetical protein
MALVSRSTPGDGVEELHGLPSSPVNMSGRVPVGAVCDRQTS